MISLSNFEQKSDVEIAVWSMDFIQDYKKKFIPTQPDAVKKYYTLPADVRHKMNDKPQDSLDFWNNKEVKYWFDERMRINNLNDRNLKWLQWMLTQLKDTEHEPAINVAIYTHQDKLEQPDWQ